jgi:hypothetical protein
MKFHLFRKSFGCYFSRFSELLDFSKSCSPESSAMRNFNKVEFSDAISGKFTRLRFSDTHNPSLRFLHRWMSLTLFPMAELCSVATPELKCLFTIVNRMKYTLVPTLSTTLKICTKCWDPSSVPPWSLGLPWILGFRKLPTWPTLRGRDPSSVPPWSLGLPWILGVRKWPTCPTLRGMYMFLVLTILVMRTSYTRNLIILYLCYMVAWQSGYLTWPLLWKSYATV